MRPSLGESSSDGRALNGLGRLDHAPSLPKICVRIIIATQSGNAFCANNCRLACLTASARARFLIATQGFYCQVQRENGLGVFGYSVAEGGDPL